MNAADLSLVAFTACNALRITAYLPQMLKLCCDPGAAASFSYSSWLMFAAANLSTAFYGQVVVGDSVLAVLNALSAACCGMLIGMARGCKTMPELRQKRAETSGRQRIQVTVYVKPNPNGQRSLFDDLNDDPGRPGADSPEKT